MKRRALWFAVPVLAGLLAVPAVAAPAYADGYCDPGVGVTLEAQPGSGVVVLSAWASNSCSPSWLWMSASGWGGGSYVSYDSPSGTTAGDYFTAALPYVPASDYSAQVCAYEYTADPLVGHACASTSLRT
jgi:hypothetical protein